MQKVRSRFGIISRVLMWGLLALVALALPYRWLPLVFLVVCVVVGASRHCLSSWRFSGFVFCGFILLTLLPIDVRFTRHPGRPRMVPLVMGLPAPETFKKAQQGEVVLGGCIVSGYEPKWLLVF